tara:strand:- start:637 stop:2430 length:1794 start_codon:yes stop_codon:yes gene_type:complete
MDIINKIMGYEENKTNNITLNNSFKLPIEYQESCKEIPENLINDLELYFFKNIDISNNESKDILSSYDLSNDNLNLYYKLFNPGELFEKYNIFKWNKYYSNDKNFLLESQNLIEKFNDKDYNLSIRDSSNSYDFILNNFNIISNMENFNDKYDYLNLGFLKKYNNNPIVMQCLSLYNIFSPILTLILPIITLILPYFIIKLQNIPVTFELYKEHLKELFKNHAIGNLFADYSSINFSTLIYIIVSLGLYIFQLYSNFYSCKKYFYNCSYIFESLNDIKKYLKLSLKNMELFYNKYNNLNTYKDFNIDLQYNIKKIKNFINSINIIEKNYNLNYLNIGKIMTNFYQLNNNEEIIKMLYYSFNFNGYIHNLNNIKNLINKNNLNKCSFTEKNTKLYDSYYIGLLDNSKIIKNTIDISKNIIITGPNASGKTTIIKSCIFNILLSQQIGYGFYKNANICIYDYIHCYINIPDTNERDSLFQAEARRCKEILDIINSNKDKRHFCIFDEIFSGTNPDDAVKSGLKYLTYLNKINNVDYMLTTHYNKLCKNINNVTNLKMKVKKTNENFNFEYKLIKGINKINGGNKILKDLEFPDEIIKII